MNEEAAHLRREFNERFSQFERNIAPFVERSTIALEKIASTERAVAEYSMRTDTTFARVFDQMEEHKRNDVVEHQKIHDKIADVATKVAVEQPQNSRIRNWIDRGVVSVVVLVGAYAAHALGLL